MKKYLFSIFCLFFVLKSQSQVVVDALGTVRYVEPATGQSVTTTGSVTTWNRVVDVTASASTTINIPTCIGNASKYLIFKRLDNTTNSVVIDPFGAETIDGQLTLTLAVGATVTIYSNGVNCYTTNGQSVVSEYGELQIPQSLQQAKSTAYAAVPSTTFTLPSAGVWDVSYDMTLSTFGGGLGEYWTTRLFNVTSGSAVSNSISNSSMDVTTQGTGQPKRFGKRVQITTTGATQFRIEAQFPNSTNNYTVSGNGSPAESGKVTWQKINGNVASAGQLTDYVQVRTAVSVTSSIPTNTQTVIFDAVGGGNIPYNTSTGVFTLSAGKTYRMQLGMRATLPSAGSSWGQYTFVDSGTNTPLIANVVARVTSSNSTGNQDNMSTAEIIYTPTTMQTVKVIQNVNQGISFGWNDAGSYVIIQQLGTSAVTGFTSPVSVNNATNSGTLGLYSVAATRFSQGVNVEFFEDAYFRFRHNATGHFEVTSVGVNRNVSAYGLNSGSTASSLPVTTDADFIGVGGYGSILAGTRLHLGRDGQLYAFRVLAVNRHATNVQYPITPIKMACVGVGGDYGGFSRVGCLVDPKFFFARKKLNKK
jgi:hypothetical protein